MDRYLRDICEHYRGKNCDPEVHKDRMPKEIQPAESIPIWEPNEALDKICAACSEGQFRIEKRECPVCGSLNIDSRIIKGLAYGSTGLSRQLYLYKCENCGKNLVSIIELK